MVHEVEVFGRATDQSDVGRTALGLLCLEYVSSLANQRLPLYL